MLFLSKYENSVVLTNSSDVFSSLEFRIYEFFNEYVFLFIRYVLESSQNFTDTIWIVGPLGQAAADTQFNFVEQKLDKHFPIDYYQRTFRDFKNKKVNAESAYLSMEQSWQNKSNIFHCMYEREKIKPWLVHKFSHPNMETLFY